MRFEMGLRLLCVGALALGCLVPRLARAQATGAPPQRMTYQGFLTDGGGAALGLNAPQSVTATFRIFDAAVGGTVIWGEQQVAVVDRGYFSVQLGEGLPLAGVTNGAASLSAAFNSAGASDRYVGLTLVGFGPGGTDVEINPRVRLTAAPYAYLATAAAGLASLGGTGAVSFGTNLIEVPGTLTATSLRAPSISVGTLTVSNSLTFSGMAGGFVMATDTAMRVIAGRHIWTNSAFLADPSPGYSVARTAVGEYTITFDQQFASIPQVVATPLTYDRVSTPDYSDAVWCDVSQSTDPTVARKQVVVRTYSFEMESFTSLIYSGVSPGGPATIYNPYWPSRGVQGNTAFATFNFQRSSHSPRDWIEFSFVVIGN